MDPVKVAPSMYQSLFENDRVRVCKATQRPGEKAPMHSHPNHLAYFLDGGRVTFAYPDGKAKDLDVKAGSATWIPGESHEVENSGDAAMEVLVVEIK
jgi:quercetin dioxygenase-like cupin family protein